MGTSQRTLFNFIGSLCVYGTICKYLNLPFVFGGKREVWEEMYIDGSDARLVAEQHIWAATNEAIYSTDGQTFNAINGPSFTWKDIWSAIGLKFGLEVGMAIGLGGPGIVNPIPDTCLVPSLAQVPIGTYILCPILGPTRVPGILGPTGYPVYNIFCEFFMNYIKFC